MPTNDNKPTGVFQKFTNYFISKWRVSIILIIAIAIIGYFGAMSNQRQVFPTITVNQLTIKAVYPGASNLDIEEKVAKPIENVVSKVDKFEKVYSSVYNNFAVFQVKLNTFDQEKISNIASQVSNDIAKAGLPSQVDYSVDTINAGGPVMVISLVDKTKTMEELVSQANEISQKLKKANSQIDTIQSFPKNEFKIEIKIDQEKLLKSGLKYQDVKQSIASHTSSIPGGSILDANDNITKAITILKLSNSTQEIENISIKNIKLSQVASVKEVLVSKGTSNYSVFVKSNGEKVVSKDSVYLSILSTPTGDAIKIDKSIKEEIKKLNLPESASLEIVYNSSNDVKKQINDLLSSGYVGLALIIIILLFFINFRAAVVVATILPLVFLVTLALLYFVGWSINILTLFGMILALGVLVDNAIVITEGMVFALADGKTRKQAALESVKNFGPSLTSSTATTLVVFLAFAFSVDGIVGEFLKYIPFTIIMMLASSYIIALSLIPLIGTWVLKEGNYQNRNLSGWNKYNPIIWSQKFFDVLAEKYGKLLSSIFAKLWIKIVLLIVSILVIVGAVSFGSKLENGQFPDVDVNTAQIEYSFKANVDQETKDEILKKMFTEVSKTPEFKGLFVKFGEVNLVLTEPSEREVTAFELIDNLNDRLQVIRDNYSGVSIKADVVSNGPPSSNYDLVINVKNDNEDKLKSVAQDLSNFLKKDYIKETVNTYSNSLVDIIEVDFNEQSLTDNKLNNMQIAGIINSKFSEIKVSSSNINNVSSDIKLEYTQESQNSLTDLKDIIVGGNKFGDIKLSDVAEVRTVKKQQYITREDGQRTVSVKVALRNSDDVEKLKSELNSYLDIKNENSEKLNNLGIENDQISYSGSAADANESVNKLILVMVISLLLIYLILVNQFNSYVKPFLIISTIAIAMAGVFPGLYFFGETMNMITGLGLVALIGIAVNDAIVFVDTFIKLRKKSDEPLNKILAQAAQDRFKPILSTTLTTVLGILPLAMADPFWTGLGIALIFGLTFSTIATLFIIPLIYAIGARFWSGAILRLTDKIFKTSYKIKYDKEILGIKN